MNLSDVSKRILSYIYWALENHPGKFICTFLGFFLALAIITVGFWKTIIIIAFTAGGYYIARCWDKKEYPLLLDKILHFLDKLLHIVTTKRSK